MVRPTIPSRRSFELGAIVVVAATVAVGWGAGSAGAAKDESFSWDVAAVAATAMATIGLVVATGVLALFTARLASFTAQLAESTAGDVSATRELAEIARADHRLATEPFLIEGTSSDEVWVLTRELIGLTLHIVNVGSGPALDVWCEVYRLHEDGSEKANIRSHSFRVIAGGERAEIVLQDLREYRSQPHEWRVRGTYVDRDGNPTGRINFGYTDSPRIRGEFKPLGSPIGPTVP